MDTFTVTKRTYLDRHNAYSCRVAPDYSDQSSNCMTQTCIYLRSSMLWTITSLKSQPSKLMQYCKIMLTWPLLSLCVQIYSNREFEDQLAKIREVLSDDKHDWEHRVVAVRLTNQMHKHTHAQWWNPNIYVVVSSSLFLCSWRRSVLSCWLGPLSTRVSLSSCASWRLPSSCLLKTCAHRWSARPASHWGKIWGRGF